MDLMLLCLIFLPLLLLLAAALVKGRKTQFTVTILLGFLFIFFALALSVNPGFTNIHIPGLLWDLLSLLTVFFALLISIRDKHYIISLLNLIQAIILIVFRITFSPAEVEPFLNAGFSERLLLAAGAVIILFFTPFIVYCLKKYGINSLYDLKRFNSGFILLLSSFAGLMASQSMTGLFLFWQWQYLSGYFFSKVYINDEKKGLIHGIIPYIQQIMLTLFLTVSVAAYKLAGSSAMQDFSAGFGKISELAAAVIYITAVLMGLLIPEYYIPRYISLKAATAAGMYLFIVSLIVPYGVLLKFIPLFENVHRIVISLMIFYGSLLVFSGAYFALLHYRNRNSLLSMIMSVSGLAVATVFKDLEKGSDFLSSNPVPLLLVIAGIVLTVAFIIMWISFLFTHSEQNSGTADEQVITFLIPFNINFSLLIKICWISTAALTLGVSLLCLR